MGDSPPPLIHLGFYKAASSWLQKYFFVPQNGYEFVLDAFALHAMLVEPGAEQFDSVRVARTLAEAGHSIEARGLLPVISSESLSGDLLRNGRNRRQNADRLKQVVSEARVLLVVREQRQLLRSLYKTMVMSGLPYSIGAMLKRGAGGGVSRLDLDFIRFDALAGYYASLYGDEAVLVLPYELFRQDPAQFLQHICRHSGVGWKADIAAELPLDRVINPGQSLAFIHMQRLINRLSLTRYRDYAGLFGNNDFGQVLRRISWHRKHARPTRLDACLERRFAAQVSTALAGKLAHSNQRLQAFCPVPLAQFAYEM